MNETSFLLSFVSGSATISHGLENIPKGPFRSFHFGWIESILWTKLFDLEFDIPELSKSLDIRLS
jgi:hypothetical protein